MDGLRLHRKVPVCDHEPGQAAGLELTLEDQPGQGVHHGLLDEALERAGAVMGIKAAGPAPRGQAQRRPSGRAGPTL